MVAVDDDGVAGGDLGGDVAQADDRGDAHGAGDDGGVAGAAAGVGGEPLTCMPVQRRGLAGKQIVGDDDDVAAEMRKVQVLLADQPMQQLPFDVVNVLDAFGKILSFILEKTAAYLRMTVLTAYSAVLR